MFWEQKLFSKSTILHFPAESPPNSNVWANPVGGKFQANHFPQLIFRETCKNPTICPNLLQLLLIVRKNNRKKHCFVANFKYLKSTAVQFFCHSRSKNYPQNQIFAFFLRTTNLQNFHFTEKI